MLSKAIVKGGEVVLDDVARIEGDASDKIGGIIVPAYMMSDDYLDRNEVKKLLENEISGAYYLGGSGVRIQEKPDDKETDYHLSGPVKRGSLIKIVVKKRKVNLEIYGTVEADTAVGQTVMVRLPSGKKISGLVVNRRKVLVEL